MYAIYKSWELRLVHRANDANIQATAVKAYNMRDLKLLHIQSPLRSPIYEEKFEMEEKLAFAEFNWFSCSA